MAASLNTKASCLLERASATFCLGIIRLSKEMKSAVCNLGKLSGPRSSPLKLRNVSLLQRPIIPFGSGKPIADCLLLMGGARAGVRELGRMWEGFKAKKGAWQMERAERLR